MPLAEPRWWYGGGALSPTARALKPAAEIWGAEAVRRYRKGGAIRLDIPVICVGNFTAGGTGKTPLSILIGHELNALDARPAFLTRGYGGSLKGPHWVAPGFDQATDVGDEPLLLANVAPTMVCRDRAVGARAIVATGARHGAIVMDDGLQNGSLAKSLTIAVVDGRRGIGNGLVIPAGPLRAPLDFQLGLVDAVIVNTPAGNIGVATPFSEWLRTHFGGPVMEAQTAAAEATDWVAAGALLAFTGIGAPQRFFDLLRASGGQLVGERVFRDHHAFKDAEARELLDQARRLGAVPCTTEKDWVRLPQSGALGALRSASRVLKVRMQLDERDGKRLRGLIETSLVGRRLATS